MIAIAVSRSAVLARAACIYSAVTDVHMYMYVRLCARTLRKAIALVRIALACAHGRL